MINDVLFVSNLIYLFFCCLNGLFLFDLIDKGGRGLGLETFFN